MYVRREGENYQQSCEERMDKADEKKIRTAMTKSNHTIKKRGLKQSHLKNMHVSKDKPTRHLYGKKHPDPFLGISMLVSEVSICQYVQHGE